MALADRPQMFAPTRVFFGMADSMEPRKMLWGRPMLPWQRNLGYKVRRSSRLPACLICKLQRVMNAAARINQSNQTLL